MHIDIHELDIGYVVESGINSYSLGSLLQVVQYILILVPDEEKRKQLSAQIADAFEKVFKEK